MSDIAVRLGRMHSQVTPAITGDALDAFVIHP